MTLAFDPVTTKPLRILESRASCATVFILFSFCCSLDFMNYGSVPAYNSAMQHLIKTITVCLLMFVVLYDIVKLLFMIDQTVFSFLTQKRPWWRVCNRDVNRYVKFSAVSVNTASVIHLLWYFALMLWIFSIQLVLEHSSHTKIQLNKHIWINTIQLWWSYIVSSFYI